MTAQQFEDLKIWQLARKQANQVYTTFSYGSPASRDYGFRDQIQRCAVSVMNNIAEGFERRSDKDFARFLDIAKGSNGEVRSMLYLAEDLIYMTPAMALDMRNLSEELSRSIQSLCNHLRTLAKKV